MGRKRHLVTDTLGLLIAVLITAANVQDRDAALPAVELAKAKVPGLAKLYVDGVYTGAPIAEIRDRHELEVEIVRRPKCSGGWYDGSCLSSAPPPQPSSCCASAGSLSEPTRGMSALGE